MRLTGLLRVLKWKSSQVAFHPNGNYVATGSLDLSIRLWDIPSGSCARCVCVHSSFRCPERLRRLRLQHYVGAPLPNPYCEVLPLVRAVFAARRG